MIGLCATSMAGEIALTVEDDGPPFDPTVRPEPTLPSSLESARIGGLGLLMVRRVAPSLQYTRVGEVNRIQMRFENA